MRLLGSFLSNLFDVLTRDEEEWCTDFRNPPALSSYHHNKGEEYHGRVRGVQSVNQLANLITHRK